MGYETVIEEMKSQFLPQKKKKYKCVQDLIELPDIMEGMYCLNDGRYIKVVEVLATNFANKEAAEQNAIISTFAGWLKISPVKCQIKITTRLAGENKFAKKLMEKEASCNMSLKRALYRSIIAYIKRLSSKSATNIRYFLIFEYEEQRLIGKKNNLKYISAQMNTVITQAQKYFSAMGNIIVNQKDDDIFLGEFLYELVNRNSSKSITFMQRARRVLNDIIKISKKGGNENAAPTTEYVNLVAPMGASLKTTPDAFIADRTYHAYYYIPSNGYPTEVQSGWLTSKFAGILDVDIDIFFRKMNKAEFVKKVRSSAKFTNLKALSRTSNSKDAGEIGGAMASQDYIRNAMSDANNPQDPFYVVTIFTVAAESYENLVQKCNALEELALTNSVELSKMTHYEWLGFKATLPFNDVPSKIYYKARRNILTDGLAGFYPFTAFELNDEEGIVIGVNSENRSIITLDPYNRAKYANGNILILGGSGKGKTYLMSLLAERTVLTGNQVFIISSEKVHEFKRLNDFLDGTFVKFAAAKHANINLFDIRPESKMIEDIYGEDMVASYRTKKAKAITGWLQLLFRNLDVDEMVALDRAVINMYEEIGITDDNESIYVDNGKKLDSNGKKILKEMPIMENLLEALIRVKEDGGAISNRLLTVIENFINGTYSSFNQQTNVDLEKEILVFDISEMSETMEAATIHLVLDFIFGKVKEDPTKQATIVIEEGWKYLSKGSSVESAKQVQEIFKIIRGYGGNVILATQELEDIMASEYGKSVIDCSAIKILLGVEEGRGSSLVKGLNIRPSEGKALESYNKGAAILIAGKDHVPIQVEASELEHPLIDTNNIAESNAKLETTIDKMLKMQI